MGMKVDMLLQVAMNNQRELKMTIYKDTVVGYDLESRLRSIAMNAIRESLIAHNRHDMPFSDDDAARMDNIFKILHVRYEQEMDRSIEHYALTDHNQKAPSPALASISGMLDKIHEDESAEITPIAKVKVASVKP